MPAPGKTPPRKRPSVQPVTPEGETTSAGFAEAVAAYHDRLATPLDDWTPHRPERPVKSALSKPLKVVSAYQPAGDQPTAIAELSEGVKAGERDQVLLGATGTGKTFTMAKVIEAAQRPALILAPNKTLAAQLYGEFKAFFPDNAVEYFVSYYDYYQPEAYVPRTDTYIEKESDINEQIDRMRHAATRALLERDDVVIVASVSCIYGIGSVETYTEMTFTLKVGETVARSRLLADLVALQYRRNDQTFARGCFRARGDVIEIFPAHYEDRAWRVSLFGDEVESIDEFDPLTGQTTGALEEIRVYANSHYVTPRPTLNQAIEGIKAELNDVLPILHAEGRVLEAQRLEQRTSFDLEMLAAAGVCSGIENYSRYLTGRAPGEPPPTLFEYLPDNALVFCDESHVTVPQIGAMFRGDFARKKTLAQYGFRLPSCMDNRPLKFEEWEKMRPQTIHLSATPGPWELNQTGGVFVEQVIRPTGLIDPMVEVRPVTGEKSNQVDDVIDECKQVAAQGGRVLVTTLTKRMAEDLTEYMHEQGVKVRYMHSDIDTLERIEIIRDLRLGAFDVLVGINLLREGLDIPECALVAILDADKEGFLRSETSLIQTIGRAARNVDGRVILYADKITGSMQRAMGETERRREKQRAHNEAHGVTPESTRALISDIARTDDEGAKAAMGQTFVGHRLRGGGVGRKAARSTRAGADLAGLAAAFGEDGAQYLHPEEARSAVTKGGGPGHNLRRHIEHLEKQMREAASNLEFEEAAAIRDEIRRLREVELAVADDPFARQEDVRARTGGDNGRAAPGRAKGRAKGRSGGSGRIGKSEGTVSTLLSKPARGRGQEASEENDRLTPPNKKTGVPRPRSSGGYPGKPTKKKRGKR